MLHLKAFALGLSIITVIVGITLAVLVYPWIIAGGVVAALAWAIGISILGDD